MSRVWVFPSLSPIWELDIVVLLMTVATVSHAFIEPDNGRRKENVTLVVTSFLLGLFTEHASLRFGGSHCHASSELLNFSECSSVNSVCYYIGWIYICIQTARRLAIRSNGTTSWTFPFLCGGLFFGMCGVYEMQGPLLGWWLWPREDGVVKPGCKIWQFGNQGLNLADMMTTEHVEEALGERIFGFPLLAPYFHSAFGWGIGLALQLTVPSFSSLSTKLRSVSPGTSNMAIISSVLLGPALGMLWDPPIRIFNSVLGANKLAAAPAVMSLVFLVPLLSSHPLVTGSYQGPRDLLLVIVPVIQHLYFVSNCLFRHGKDIIPGNLKLFICCVALLSLLLHFKAIGYFSFIQVEYENFKGEQSFNKKLIEASASTSRSTISGKGGDKVSTRDRSRRSKSKSRSRSPNLNTIHND